MYFTFIGLYIAESKVTPMFPIEIKKGHYGFNKDITVDFKTNLVVITGVNGSGKTNLLKCIKENSNANNAVFLKTTLQNKVNTGRRVLTPMGFTYLDNIDIPEVGEVIEEVKREYKKRINATASENDYLRCLFEKGSVPYNSRVKFVGYVLTLMKNRFGDDVEERFQIKFGIPTNAKIKQFLRSEVEVEYKKEKALVKIKGEKHKEEIEIRTKEAIKNKYDYAFSSILKSNVGYEISTVEKFEQYIWELINPFQEMEGIISRLSSIISDDNADKAKTRGGSKKIWEKINNILNGKAAGGSDLQDEAFSKAIQKIFNYELTEPSKWNKKYELTFQKKNGQGNVPIHFEELSTGEKVIFELICYVYIFTHEEKNKTKILLLDEFDANLNPHLTTTYVKMIQEYLIKEAKLKVIITTHSPSTVVEIEPKYLWEMRENEFVECAKDQAGKNSILKNLAPKFINYNVLGIFSFLGDSRNVIIFCEGAEDFEYYGKYLAKNKTALNDICTFVDCGGARNMPSIYTTLNNTSLKELITNKTQIYLWDFDFEGIDSLIRASKDTTKDNCNTQIKAKKGVYIEKSGVHFMTLIPPENHESYDNYFKYGDKFDHKSTTTYRKQELALEDKMHDDTGSKRLFLAIENIISLESKNTQESKEGLSKAP